MSKNTIIETTSLSPKYAVSVAHIMSPMRAELAKIVAAFKAKGN